MIPRSKSRAFPRPYQLFIVVLLNVGCWVAIGYAIYAGFQQYLLKNYGAPSLAQDTTWTIRACVGMGVAVALALLSTFYGLSMRCPLCHGTPFAATGNRKHQLSVKFPLLGYRASAVLCLITIGRFVCMHCGTPFRWRR